MSEISTFEEHFTGDGQVVLLAGGGKIFTDIAARFVKSERDLEEIVASPYSRTLVKAIMDSGHRAAMEVDFFLLGVEGYSRVTEVQLVRKRHASYVIKSGRAELGGKRKYSVVYPRNAAEYTTKVTLPNRVRVDLSGRDIAEITRQWYEAGVNDGLPEEDLRYLKPQATEFKAIIGMNAHALLDWFEVRCCLNAQKEIRDMANKTLRLVREAAPDLFENAGPKCLSMGYCPENGRQNAACAARKNRVLTKDEALEVLKRAQYIS